MHSEMDPVKSVFVYHIFKWFAEPWIEKISIGFKVI